LILLKPGRKIQNGMRLIALLMVCLFSFSTILQAEISGFFPKPPFLTGDLAAFSPEQGSVQEVFFPQSPKAKTPFIYLIQDAHDSLDAQENIRHILKTLVEKEQVQTVCFEGGSLELDRGFFNFSNNTEENKRIWDELFKRGEIGGLERYALEAPQSTRFYGVEDEAIYLDNLQTIQKVYKNEEKAKPALQEFEFRMNRLTGRFLTGDLKKIRDLRKAYDEKRLSLMDYAHELADWAKKILQLDLLNPSAQREWPELVRLIRLKEFQEKIKEKDSGFRIQDSVKLDFDSRLPTSLNFVMDPSQHWRAKGHLRWYFEKAIDFGFDPSSYSGLSDWIAFHVLHDELSALDLSEELERLEKMIWNNINVSVETRKFLTLEREWFLTKKLIYLELSRKEWQEVTKNRFSFVKHSGLREWIESARRNYEIVKSRDKILSKETEHHLMRSGNLKIALVVGGFHSDALTAYFKKNNYGYAVLNPAIRDISRKINYREHMGSLSLEDLSEQFHDQTALPKTALKLEAPRNRIRNLVRALGKKFSASSLGVMNGKRLGVRDPYWQRKFAEDDLKIAPEILESYDIGTLKPGGITPTLIGLGEHGKALIVETDRGKYVLKPLTTFFYPELENGARFEISVVSELASKGHPVARLVPTKKVEEKIPEDQYFVKARNGKIYLLYEFVDGKQLSNKKLNRKQFQSLVDVLARMHEELKGFTPRGKRTFQSVLDFHVRRERLRQLRGKILGKRKQDPSYAYTRGERFFIKNTDFILRQIDLLESNLPPLIYESLPKTIIHGDYHLWNIIFQGDQVAGVFDWDHQRYEARIYDFFNNIFPMQTGHNTFDLEGLLKVIHRYQKTSRLNPFEIEALQEVARLRFLGRVLIEKPLERLKYKEELAGVDPLELVVKVIDLDDYFCSWINGKLAALKDINNKIRSGKFRKSLNALGGGKSLGAEQGFFLPEDFFSGNLFETAYGVRKQSIIKMARLLRGVFGKGLRDHFPMEYDEMLDNSEPEFQEAKLHTLVLAKEPDPKVLLKQIAKGAMAVIYYRDENYPIRFERAARRMIEEGVLTENQLENQGYLVSLNELGLSEKEFLTKLLLRGKSISFRQGKRSLSWLMQTSGSQGLVWLNGKPIRDFEFQRFIINDSGEYRPKAGFIETVLKRSLLKNRVKKSMKTMA